MLKTYFLFILFYLGILLNLSGQKYIVDWKFSTISLNQGYLQDEGVLHKSFHDGTEYRINAPLGFSGVRSKMNEPNLKCFLSPNDTMQIDVSDLPYNLLAFEILKPVVFARNADDFSPDSLDQAFSKLQVANLSDGNRDLIHGFNDNGRVDSTFSNNSSIDSTDYGTIGGSGTDENSGISSSTERNYLVVDSNIQILEFINRSNSASIGFDLSPLININELELSNPVMSEMNCESGISIMLDISASVDSSECKNVLSQVHEFLQVLTGTSLQCEIITFAETYSTLKSMSDIDSVVNEWAEIDSMVHSAREDQINGPFTNWPLSYIQNTNRALFILFADGLHSRDKSRTKQLIDYNVIANSASFMGKNVAFIAFNELSEYSSRFFKTAFHNDFSTNQDTLYRKSLYRIPDISYASSLDVLSPIVDQLLPCTILHLEGVAVENDKNDNLTLFTKLDPLVFDGLDFSRPTKIVRSDFDPNKHPEIVKTQTPLSIAEAGEIVADIEVYKWNTTEEFSSDIILYPNPGRNRFQLSSLKQREFNQITIRDARGAVVLENVFPPRQMHEFILNKTPAGYYTVIITNESDDPITIPFLKL